MQNQLSNVVAQNERYQSIIRQISDFSTPPDSVSAVKLPGINGAETALISGTHMLELDDQKSTPT